MALGRRKREHQDQWVVSCDLPKSPSYPFYAKLNRLLDEADFDSFAENLCSPHYAERQGRPGIPPGVYFRMLFIGYMEGLTSQRTIAWRCSDSRSLQSFLGYAATETTPDHSSLAKMKDGRTHLAYKTEHAIDLDTDIVVAAGVYKADESDTATFTETLVRAQTGTVLVDSESQIKDVVADKEYHSTDNLVQCDEWGIRSYIPERENRWGRKWTDKHPQGKHAVYGNRRRVQGRRGKRRSRLRSEYVERSFAHVCETGSARRSWLRGLEDVTKRYLMTVAGRNLGVIMRALISGWQTENAAGRRPRNFFVDLGPNRNDASVPSHVLRRSELWHQLTRVFIPPMHRPQKPIHIEPNFHGSLKSGVIQLTARHTTHWMVWCCVRRLSISKGVLVHRFLRAAIIDRKALPYRMLH